MRVGAYTRVSTEAQATEEKVSLDEQRKDIAAYCEAKDYQIVSWYSDVGSGASKRRPDFQRILKDAQAGHFDVIVAWKSDRLSRGMYPAAALMKAVEAADVKLEAVKDTIDLNTFALLAVVGKIELDNIRERVRMGMRGKASRGAVSGKPRFGYRNDGPKGNKRPVIDEVEAAIVRRVFTEYLTGVGAPTIARRLRADGVLTRTGKEWQASSISSILSHPAYIGQGRYGRYKYFTKDDGERDVRTRKKMPEDTWIRVEYPPIIDERTWAKAREKSKHQTRHRTGKYASLSYMLKGLLWCGECGRKYTTNAAPKVTYYTRKDGTRARYSTGNIERRYFCLQGTRDGGHCSRPRITAPRLESNIWETVKTFLKDPSRIGSIIAERRRALEESGTLPELQEARELVQAVEQQEARALDLYLEGTYDRNYLDLKIRQIQEKKEYHQGELERLERESDDAVLTIEFLSDFLASAKRIAGRLETMAEAERFETVCLLVDRVTISGDAVNVVIALNLEGDLTPATQ